MSQYKQNDAGMFLGGIILGGLVGAALGVLFAPQSGDKTRSQIKKRGEDIYNDAKDKTIEFKGEYVDPKVKNAKLQISKKLEEANNEINKKTKRVVKELKD